MRYQGSVGLRGESYDKKTTNQTDYKQPRASRKGGGAGQKRLVPFRVDATRNLVDHRQSCGRQNFSRHGYERNVSNIQIGKPDPKWEAHKRSKAVKAANEKQRQLGGVGGALDDAELQRRRGDGSPVGPLMSVPKRWPEGPRGR